MNSQRDAPTNAGAVITQQETSKITATRCPDDVLLRASRF